MISKSLYFTLGLLFYCSLLSLGAPTPNFSRTLTSATETSQDTMQAIADLGRPYPSVSLSSSDQWDLVLIFDYSVASTNYASMYNDPENYDMLREVQVQDCETPASEWYYPNGTCITLDLTISSPNAALSDMLENLLEMNITSGWYRLSNSDMNETQDLSGTQLNALTKLEQQIFEEEKNLIYFDASNSSVSAVEGTYPGTTNPVIVSYVEDIVSSTLRNKSQNVDSFPFIKLDKVISNAALGNVFGTSSNDSNSALIPTATSIQSFTSSVNGNSLIACFMMTLGHQEPDDWYIDTSIDYTPDGMDFFMIISNKLLMNDLLLSDSEYDTKAIQLNTTSGYPYYNVDSTWYSNQSFQAYQKAEISISHMDTCWLYDLHTFNLNLGSAHLFMNGSVLSNLELYDLNAEFNQLPYCVIPDNGFPYSMKTNFKFSYKVIAYLEVNGGYLSSTITTVDECSLPEASQLGSVGNNTYNEVQYLHDSVANAANVDNFFGTFNVFVDDVQAVFGPSEGVTAQSLNLTDASLVYDMLLVGYVNFD